jgi:hypothetical protein
MEARRRMEVTDVELIGNTELGGGAQRAGWGRLEPWRCRR